MKPILDKSLKKKFPVSLSFFQKRQTKQFIVKLPSRKRCLLCAMVGWRGKENFIIWKLSKCVQIILCNSLTLIRLFHPLHFYVCRNFSLVCVPPSGQWKCGGKVLFVKIANFSCFPSLLIYKIFILTNYKEDLDEFWNNFFTDFLSTKGPSCIRTHPVIVLMTAESSNYSWENLQWEEREGKLVNIVENFMRMKREENFEIKWVEKKDDRQGKTAQICSLPNLISFFCDNGEERRRNEDEQQKSDLIKYASRETIFRAYLIKKVQLNKNKDDNFALFPPLPKLCTEYLCVAYVYSQSHYTAVSYLSWVCLPSLFASLSSQFDDRLFNANLISQT